MEIKYYWEIKELVTKKQLENLTDVVVIVHWVRKGETIVNGEIFESSMRGSMSCDSPSEIDFTAYQNLTFEQVCGWLESGLGYMSFDAELENQINDKVNPPVVSLPLPWIK